MEAEDDDYIRYITQIDTCCAICSTKLNIKVDVWEHPEAVSNYSYYDVQGAHDIQCEFNIEHYFDDEAPGRKVEREVGGESEGETDTEHDEKKFNETLDPNTYVDNYDDDN